MTLIVLIALSVAASSTLISARPASALGTLGSLSWSSTDAGTGTAAAYTFGFTTSASAGSNLSSITMTVPTGTGGTPTLGTVTAWQPSFSPVTLPGQSISLASNTLTFSFTSTFINPSTVFSIQVNGLTNTTTAGANTSTITTKNGATVVDNATTPSLAFTATELSNQYSAASSNVMGATATAYTYAFTTGTTSNLSSVTMTVPPGTGGTPAVGTVTGVPTGGTPSISGQILTYTFTSTSVPAGTVASVQFTGLTNTNSGLAAQFGGEIVTKNGATLVNAGALDPLAFTVDALTATSWSASSNSTGDTNVAYTYGFTTPTALNLSSFTMTVPPGTGGTPAVGTVSAQVGFPITIASPSVSLSGNTLTFSFTPVFFQTNTVVSIQITGLTNTSVAGAYPSSLVSMATPSTNKPPPFEAALAPAVTFTSTNLTALSWSVSSTATGATGVTYSYSFGLSANATLSSITMSVPPGTTGPPTFVSASPAALTTGRSMSLVGQTLTYSFTAAAISSSSTINIVLSGFTNTSTPSVYAASVIANNGASAVASGTTPAISFTSGVLTSLSLAASS
ncbi:MAG TPA: hypothetical protein VHU17_16905, partial [Acidimicrobiales bacterium]|nr:hypothetical protein [Acidimicrobiales bacterium]